MIFASNSSRSLSHVRTRCRRISVVATWSSVYEVPQVVPSFTSGFLQLQQVDWKSSPDNHDHITTD